MDPQALESEALSAIEASASPAELDDARVRYLGRKSELKQALREVRDRETGMVLNAVRERLEAAAEARETALRAAELEAVFTGPSVDVTLPGERPPRGHLHLITQIRREVEDIFLGLGYEVYDGDEVATVFENFDALTTEPGHPSRSSSDTFYLDESTVLRTHTSPDQIRVMQSRTPPIYMVSLGRCYRRDTPDATHSPTFNQVECLAVDRRHHARRSQGHGAPLLARAVRRERDVRMRTSYFPFTEPSVEFDVSCFLCDGAGCAVCKHSGWIEMGGAGVVDPDVFVNVGYRPRGGARASRSGSGSSGSRCCGTACRTSGSSGRTTSACSGSSDEGPGLLAARVRRVRAAARGARPPARLHELRGRPDRRGSECPTWTANLGNFRVGRVLEAGKHPNADKLQLCVVDVGDGEPRSIVCGAWNFGAGATVAVALPGAAMPDGLVIEKRKLRGEVSEGMILSERELELGRTTRGSWCWRTASSRARRSPTSCPLSEDVLEIETGFNRPDLTSIYGIAREVSALLDVELAPPPGANPAQAGDEPVDVRIDDFEGCPRYVGRLFRDVTIGPSPVWLRARLTAAGMRPISNVVDVTNYVMIGLGSPLHAFDFTKLEDGPDRRPPRRRRRGAAHARRHAPPARSSATS